MSELRLFWVGFCLLCCLAATAGTLYVGDISVTEGDAGVIDAAFPLCLSAPADTAVTVQYATQDGTALAGEDYTAAAGTVTFQPGDVYQTVVVKVQADTSVEPNELFTLALSNPVNTALDRAAAQCTILNDDVAGTDLSLQMTQSPSPVEAGAKVTYTLTVHNNGSTDVSGVTLTDTLPAGVPYVSATTSQGACVQNGGQVVANIGLLPAHATATVKILLMPAAVTPALCTNAAVVSCTQTETNMTNNSASCKTGVVRAGSPVRAGFSQYDLPANDDYSTGLVPMKFPVLFYGLPFTRLYVNNNGNITFDAPLDNYSPFDLTTTGKQIIAAYFADMDTQGVGSDVAHYGYGTVNGHRAFGVNWLNIGYYAAKYDKLVSSQLVLINRSDLKAGDFNFEFNYDKIQWEAGDMSGGSGGLGGQAARAGFSNGTNLAGTAFELPGSAVPGAFLDGNTAAGLIWKCQNTTQPGRYLFQVRNGQVQQADLALTGVAVPDTVFQGNTLSYSFTVTNTGSATAPNCVFTDVLPAGVSYVSNTRSMGALLMNGNTATWHIGALPGGATATLTLVVLPGQLGNVQNNAAVQADVLDANPANNAVSLAATVVASPQVAMPTFTPLPGRYITAVTVTINCMTPGATIHYTTDGATPTANSPVYTDPLVLTTPTVLSAIATAVNATPSPVASGQYVVTAVAPVFTPAPGAATGPVTVEITSATPGAVIYYTTDGATPTEYSTLYAGPVTLTHSATLRAIATLPGLADSDVTTGTYTLGVLAPTISPDPYVVYDQPVDVTLACDTPNAVIYYTLDDTDPTLDSAVYADPIPLAVSTVVKAFAARDGMLDSGMVTAAYTISPTLTAPIMLPEGGSFTGSVTVTIAAEADTIIHYTLDGTTPTEESPLYPGAFVLTQSTVVKARAFKFGASASAVTTQAYTLVAETPSLSPSPGAYNGSVTITLLTATVGAEIRYTLDGNTPTAVSALYTAPFKLATSATVTAVAFKAGMSPSLPVQGAYVMRVGLPIISPASGTFTAPVKVTINCATFGAIIRYTINGTTPTSTSPIYTGPLLVAASVTITVRAFKAGLTDSAVTSATFFFETPPQVEAPVFNPPSGVFARTTPVAITCATAGALIRYTLDGKEPTTISPLYTAPVSISTTAVLKARAFKAPAEASPVTEGRYTITGDAYEPDNAAAQAKVIINGQVQPRSLSPARDTDWVRFVLNQRSEVRIATAGPSGDTLLWLYGPNNPGLFVTYNDDAGPGTAFSQINRQGAGALEPGTYYIKVQGFCGLAVPAYTLGLFITTPGQVASPVLAPRPGTYRGTVTVHLTSATPGATLRYTRDGSEPTPASLLYNEATGIVLPVGTHTIKAAAFTNGLRTNAIVAGTYVVQPAADKP